MFFEKKYKKYMDNKVVLIKKIEKFFL